MGIADVADGVIVDVCPSPGAEGEVQLFARVSRALKERYSRFLFRAVKIDHVRTKTVCGPPPLGPPRLVSILPCALCRYSRDSVVRYDVGGRGVCTVVHVDDDLCCGRTVRDNRHIR